VFENFRIYLHYVTHYRWTSITVCTLINNHWLFCGFFLSAVYYYHLLHLPNKPILC